MAGEPTVPILPVHDLDEAIDFYESLGFVRSYRQVRPNPYAVVEHEAIVLHLVGIPGYHPAASVCSVIVTVPDAEALHDRFAEGFRTLDGRLHSDGVTRLLRIRSKAGTATGFSIVTSAATG